MGNCLHFGFNCTKLSGFVKASRHIHDEVGKLAQFLSKLLLVVEIRNETKQIEVESSIDVVVSNVFLGRVIRSR